MSHSDPHPKWGGQLPAPCPVPAHMPWGHFLGFVLVLSWWTEEGEYGCGWEPSEALGPNLPDPRLLCHDGTAGASFGVLESAHTPHSDRRTL